jgi:hypothetical protein
MLEVTTVMEDRGLMARLRLIKKALGRRKVEVEKELSKGGELGEEVDVSVYGSDAEESLAMALGKNTGKGVSRTGVVFNKPLGL